MCFLPNQTQNALYIIHDYESIHMIISLSAITECNSLLLESAASYNQHSVNTLHYLNIYRQLASELFIVMEAAIWLAMSMVPS